MGSDVRAATVMVAWVFVAGCGFRTLGSGSDGGAVADLSGLPPGTDLAMQQGGTGPGPRGALPAGYCCTADTECRSRQCTTVGSVSFCNDECHTNDLCNARGAALICNLSTELCEPSSGSFACLDPQTYHYGTKPFGACCASGFTTSGEECLGGLCNATGPSSNPFRCTQGCSATASDACPSGFSCMIGWCWPNDPNSTYTCQ